MGVHGFESQQRGVVAPTTARWPSHQHVPFRGRRGVDIVDSSYARVGARTAALITCLLPFLTGVAEGRLRRDGDHSTSLIATATLERRGVERGREPGDVARRLILAQRTDQAQSALAQPATPRAQKATTESEQQRNMADALAREMTSAPRTELNVVQSASEGERIKQKQALDQERERGDKLARELAAARAELDAARQTQAHTVRAIEVGIRQTQALEQERERANNLARELSFLKAELDIARVAASKAMQTSEAELKQEPPIERRNGSKRLALQLVSLKSQLGAARTAESEAAKSAAAEAAQRQALEQELKQEQDKAEALTSELSNLRTTMTATQAAASVAAKATVAHVEERQALERELEKQRDKADTAARQLSSLHAELSAAKTASSELANSRAADAKQKQALERELGQQRTRVDALAREAASLKNERDAARAATPEAVRTAEGAAKAEARREIEKERARSETLTSELASTRKQVEERSTRLAAADAKLLQMTEANAAAAEQKLALDKEHERADGLVRELASVRAQLEDANRKLAARNASTAAVLPSREGAGRAPGHTGTQATATPPARPSASTATTPNAPVTKRPAPPDPDPKVVPASERSAPANASPRPLANEQRLLARANALLRQSDINGARGLLEYVVGQGSARAAFMLAETYDPHVLQLWDARGVAGDSAKARELYERAQAGGIDDAEGRIKGLK
ncbi:hypothetical protein AYJ54_10385 [Bradyrhizobium centrolobii]|uniref:Uncharacterized protein n=2 Tax=Bradyrhizobium centrolobii TaxID=1505087 RepID=A0A176YUT4_9BRAD|nr:hypothetical protein AYJ54_10385 [Bradyrhizobium centrolobii]